MGERGLKSGPSSGAGLLTGGNTIRGQVHLNQFQLNQRSRERMSCGSVHNLLLLSVINYDAI